MGDPIASEMLPRDIPHPMSIGVPAASRSRWLDRTERAGVRKANRLGVNYTQIVALRGRFGFALRHP